MEGMLRVLSSFPNGLAIMLACWETCSAAVGSCSG